MKAPNENGVYEAEIVEELARVGRSHATISVARCGDGLLRFAIDVQYSYGGLCGPITDHGEGFESMTAVKEAATRELLRRFPKGSASDPQSVHDELREMKAQIEQGYREPTLF